jgi:hypothetical protein
MLGFYREGAMSYVVKTDREGATSDFNVFERRSDAEAQFRDEARMVREGSIVRAALYEAKPQDARDAKAAVEAGEAQLLQIEPDAVRDRWLDEQLSELFKNIEASRT